jgi:succinyl-diaminopimelate desuccinylase
VRYLPEQKPRDILAEVSEIEGARVISTFTRPPARVDPESTFVRTLCEAAAPFHPGEIRGIGRDGASDAVSFLRVGVPAVEFGPAGGGHHGPEEWVSVASLVSYRRAIASFVEMLPDRAADGAAPK